MKSMALIIGVVILVAILIGAFTFFKQPNRNIGDLEFNKYIFSEGELNFGTLSAPPRETGDCRVHGIITDVKLVESHDVPCLSGEEGCTFNVPEQYVMRVYLQEIKSLSEGNYEETCEDLVQISKSHIFYILKDKITEMPKDRLTIEGVIKGSIDMRRFDSYSLEEINY